ncbi:Ski oncolocus tag [Aphelenchoides besseyi]|nr:Ski oncolocus tag [Aphelenchoides besseyi]KAI6211572.1 Ski oncolocus tag [Aphelenchoides besseyi]
MDDDQQPGTSRDTADQQPTQNPTDFNILALAAALSGQANPLAPNPLIQSNPLVQSNPLILPTPLVRPSPVSIAQPNYLSQLPPTINPEHADILMQEIARLSEQQRRQTSFQPMDYSTWQANINRLLAEQTVNQLQSSRVADAISSNQTPTTTQSVLAPLIMEDQPSTSGFRPPKRDNTGRLLTVAIPGPSSQSQQQEQQQQYQEQQEERSPSPEVIPEEQAIFHLAFQTNSYDPTLPMSMQRDNNISCLSKFRVGNYQIYGFLVSNEPRLCLPQFKALFLPEFTEWDELLHRLKIKPANAYGATSCQMIPRTCAYMIINFCIINQIRPLNGCGDVDRFMPQQLHDELAPEAVTICHCAFGGQNGRYYRSLLGKECIECVDCARLLNPLEFIGHSHNMEEFLKQAIGWGFDPTQWSSYLNLPITEPDEPWSLELEEAWIARLEELKKTSYPRPELQQSRAQRRAPQPKAPQPQAPQPQVSQSEVSQSGAAQSELQRPEVPEDERSPPGKRRRLH